jgi:hypothetical protein
LIRIFNRNLRKEGGRKEEVRKGKGKTTNASYGK